MGVGACVARLPPGPRPAGPPWPPLQAANHRILRVNFRTLTLAMLSIALAGTLAGTIVGIFLESDEAWRLAGTSLILTIMSGIWAAVTRAGESRATPVVLTTVIGTGCAAACFVGATWMPINATFGSLMASGASFLGATIAGAMSMRALAFPLTGRSGRVAFGIQMAALACWLAASWAIPPVVGDDGFRGWIIMLASPIAFMICFGDARERNRLPELAALTILGLAVVILLTIAADAQQPWNLGSDERRSMERRGALAVMLATVALAVGMLRVFRHARGGRVARVIHWATVAAVVIEGALLTAYIVEFRQGDTVERVLVAFPAMILSGGAISAVLDRMARAIKAVSVLDLKDLQCDCPRCKHRQRIPVDGRMHPCARCGLGFSIVLSQRQCFACSYDLSGSLGAVTCPECGAPVVTQPLALAGAVPPPPVAGPSSAT